MGLGDLGCRGCGVSGIQGFVLGGLGPGDFRVMLRVINGDSLGLGFSVFPANVESLYRKDCEFEAVFCVEDEHRALV